MHLARRNHHPGLQCAHQCVVAFDGLLQDAPILVACEPRVPSREYNSLPSLSRSCALAVRAFLLPGEGDRAQQGEQRAGEARTTLLAWA